MKKNLLTVFMLGAVYTAQAQYNPAASVLPSAMINEAYVGQVINFTVPATAEIDGSVVIDPLLAGFGAGLPPGTGAIIGGLLGGQTIPLSVSNTTLTVTGLPAGVTATCNATPCTYMAGASGTITLSGTPTSGGIFTVNINSSTNGDADLSAISAIDPTGQVPSTFALPQAVPGALDEQGYTMNVSDPAGIEEANEVFSLGLYPNPTDGLSTLNVNSTVAGVATIEVYSITGALIQTTANSIRVGANRLNLDLTSVPAGIYMVKADINGHQALVRTQKK